jgi:hypothetical protein
MRTLRTAALLLTLAAPAAAADLWFHLRVSELDGDRSKVSVNLPLASVTRALAVVPDVCGRRCRVRVNDHDISAPEFRSILRQLESNPASVVKIDRDEDELTFSRRSDQLVMSIVDSIDAERAEVTMPFALAQALGSGDGRGANAAAGAAWLASRGQGEVLLLTAEDAEVRMWVDGAPDPSRITASVRRTP